VAPTFWREDLFLGKGERPLRFGYFVNSKFIEAFPACARAVQQTTQLLLQKGYEVVPFDMVDGSFMEIYLALMSADGLETVKEELNGSQIDDAVSGMISLANFPSW
jgi:hypothetical protein